MIKVLHFISKMDRAGQETFIMNVFRNADKSEFSFVFLCSKKERGDYDEEIRALGGQIFYLDNPAPTKGISKYANQISSIAEWLKNHRTVYDIVHLHTYHALDVLVHLEACRRANVKNIFVHSHNSFGQHEKLHKFCRLLFPLYKFERLACSKDAAEWMYGSYAYHRGKVEIILNGIDTHEFMFDENKRDIKRTELCVQDKTVVGHIGRFNEQKNHYFLIDVFNHYHKMHTDAVLLLVGKGELENDIRKYVHKLGLGDYIIFLGTRTDIAELLSAIDIFVFPSHYEGLSVVLIEAQCSGLNILCTSNVSPETVISKGMHLLPVSKAENWAKEIDKYAGKRIKNTNIEKIDISVTSRKLLDLYRWKMRTK